MSVIFNHNRYSLEAPLPFFKSGLRHKNATLVASLLLKHIALLQQAMLSFNNIYKRSLAHNV